MLFRLVPPASRWLSARLPALATDHGEPPTTEAVHRAIVVGCGPVGRTLGTLLRENELEPTFIELNHETVKHLHREGIRAIYGDASQREILERAGIGDATSLVFAASGSPDAVIRLAKALNPRITIVARATYVREVAALREAGADVVLSAEGEVALAMAERLLERLGATRDQLDRARDRVRAELPTG
jgi:CPA2 family monovalent cation:H+ antiporter-2